ncbi:putative RNA-binding protein [Blattamonas nauphoetae]|uniref:RNA-binding protein n=1 Tax=Blattamonas nauphoetae TaxID=2049346 RepID=A0ABQ9Y658_9EUKA|nr:putative RNA-binding protein [Blattamonas nauphoetae]
MSSSKAPLSKQKSKKTQQNPEKQPDPEKRKTVRYSGGEVWEDASLADWPENDFRMWVGDLGPEVTDEMLTREFSVYPSFNKAKVVKDNKTKKSKGYGFLSFGTLIVIDEAKPHKKDKKKKQTKEPFFGFRRKNHYWVELFFIVLIVVMLSFYLWGKKKNEQIVSDIFYKVQPIMANNFTVIGNGINVTIFKESNSNFRIYGSGRKNIRGFSVFVELLPRQDVVGFVYQLLTGQQDKVTLQCVCDESVDAFIMAISKPGFASRLRNERMEIEKFTQEVSLDRLWNSSSFDDNFVCLAEHPKFVSEVGQKCSTLFQDIHVSTLILADDPFKQRQLVVNQEALAKKEQNKQTPKDDSPTPVDYRILQIALTFRLEKEIDLKNTVGKMLDFCDFVSEHKFNSDARDRCRTHRREAAAELSAKDQKDKDKEILQKRKREQEKYNQMTPEEQKKYDAKQAKKDAKKQNRIKFQ